MRGSPDGTMVAVHWPSPPSRLSWALLGRVGPLGFETPERVAHWPVMGAMPGTPAAGAKLRRAPLLAAFEPSAAPSSRPQAPEPPAETCECVEGEPEHRRGGTPTCVRARKTS